MPFQKRFFCPGFVELSYPPRWHQTHGRVTFRSVLFRSRFAFTPSIKSTKSYCPYDKEVVSRDEIAMGYEIEKDKYILVQRPVGEGIKVTARRLRLVVIRLRSSN